MAPNARGLAIAGGMLLVGACTLLGWAACGRDPAPAETPGPAPAATRPPNVLIVLWDTVRADRMSVYGHDRPTTPKLEALASQATVYEQATSPGMWTVPAHGSMFTGLTAASHGAKVGWLWLDQHHVTLAEHFGSQGYATWAWSSNPYLSDATNLLQGFDTVELSWAGSWAEAAGRATRSKLIERDRSVEISPGFVPGGAEKGWPEHLTAFKDGAPVAGEALLAWLDGREADGPWLAYLNLLEAHHPRVPSLSAREAVLPDALVEAGLQTEATLMRTMSAMEGRHTFTGPELAAMAGVYDATLHDLDTATATLLDGLRSRELLDETIVVIVSDHGEHLGEHGLHDHRWSLHQPLVHVPLIVRRPGGAAERVATPVSTAHLFGSLVAWTGVAPPQVDHALPELGAEPRAFTELVAPTPRLPEIRAAFPELRGDDRWKRRYQAMLEGGWKLWRVSDGKHRLYDLGRDPGELDDRIDAEAARGRAMWKAVVAWDEARPAYDPSKRRPDDRPGSPLELDDALREQLKLLGYAADDEDPP